jgi:hypothetical protein
MEEQKLAQDVKEFWQTPQAASPDAPTKTQWSKDDRPLFDDVNQIIQGSLYYIAKDEDFTLA